MYMTSKVLIINQNEAVAKEIQTHIAELGSEVMYATTIQDSLRLFMQNEFSLIILDAKISNDDDHKLLGAMRETKSTPILVLSSLTNHEERLHVFKAGAHAYMGHPYSLEECVAQAHSLMQLYLDRTSEGKMCYTLAFGNGLMIDPSTRQVFIKGKEVNVTRKEFDLLFWLASNPGKVFTREQLYDHVWDEQSAHNVDEVVKHHIKTLRKKLTDANSEYIKNVWGIGYRFEHGSKTDGE